MKNPEPQPSNQTSCCKNVSMLEFSESDSSLILPPRQKFDLTINNAHKLNVIIPKISITPQISSPKSSPKAFPNKNSSVNQGFSQDILLIKQTIGNLINEIQNKIQQNDKKKEKIRDLEQQCEKNKKKIKNLKSTIKDHEEKIITLENKFSVFYYQKSLSPKEKPQKGMATSERTYLPGTSSRSIKGHLTSIGSPKTKSILMTPGIPNKSKMPRRY